MAGSGVFPKSQNDKIYSGDYNAIRSVAGGVVESFYGNPMSSNNVTKEKITAAQMGSLRYDINRAYKHITGVNGIGSVLARGNKVTATNFNSYKNTADYCETNKLLVDPTQLATTVYSNNFTSTWTGIHVWQTVFTWSTNAKATYFFNAGGYFEVGTNGTNSTGSTQDKLWHHLLNTMPLQTYTRNNWIYNIDINRKYHGGGYYGYGYGYGYASDYIRTQVQKIAANQLMVTITLHAHLSNINTDAYGAITEYCSVDAIIEESPARTTVSIW